MRCFPTRVSGKSERFHLKQVQVKCVTSLWHFLWLWHLFPFSSFVLFFGVQLFSHCPLSLHLTRSVLFLYLSFSQTHSYWSNLWEISSLVQVKVLWNQRTNSWEWKTSKTGREEDCPSSTVHSECEGIHDRLRLESVIPRVSGKVLLCHSLLEYYRRKQSGYPTLSGGGLTRFLSPLSFLRSYVWCQGFPFEFLSS